MNLRGSAANSYVCICLDVKTEVHTNEMTCLESSSGAEHSVFWAHGSWKLGSANLSTFHKAHGIA